METIVDAKTTRPDSYLAWFNGSEDPPTEADIENKDYDLYIVRRLKDGVWVIPIDSRGKPYKTKIEQEYHPAGAGTEVLFRV